MVECDNLKELLSAEFIERNDLHVHVHVHVHVPWDHECSKRDNTSDNFS